MKLKDDYRNYRKGNDKLLSLLKNSDSVLYNHLADVVYVLDYLSEHKEKHDENDYDLSIIFETGFRYFHSQLEQIKIYYEHCFDHDYAAFRRYETLICFSLYLDDFGEALAEKEYLTPFRKDCLAELAGDIEKIIYGKLQWTTADLENFNMTVSSCVPDRINLKTTEMIFAEIAEEIEIIG